MRILSAAALCPFVIAAAMAAAQAPSPAAVAPLAKADPNRPDSPQRGNSPGTPTEQAGRNALYKYLDDIAAKDEAARREAIAKITTREQAEDRQTEVRQKVLALMGGGFKKTPLNAKVLGSTEMDGFRIEKVVYESQPNFFVTALLYLPEGAATDNVKVPAIVMAPGHASSGKAGDFAMASTFARNGFAVLSYDPIGQGERLQYPDPKNAAAMQAGDPYPGLSLATRATGEHGEAGLQPTLIGDAVARYFAWDGMRAVDYLISRPEVDPEKIGAFGCSGGGAMTALLGAADKRVKAIATACYITSMDALLPAIGPQDAEQSVPGWVAAGLDFADWVEMAAPRPYAIVGTVGDMFPWAGLISTARQARRFYGLFDARALGSCQLQVAGCEEKQPPTPTGPTLNPDTSNTIAADAPLQVIAGIGGHGNLRPLTSQIVGFFLVNLAGRKAEEFVAPAPLPPGMSPIAAAAAEMAKLPKGALQVTATGQVATSYPGSATVHSLNLLRAKEKIPEFVAPQTLLQVQTDVREVTNAEAVPGASTPRVIFGSPVTVDPSGATVARGEIETEVSISLQAAERRPATSHACNEQPHPATLLLIDVDDGKLNSEIDDATRARMVDPCRFVLWVQPRPSPPGTEETKSPILGPFYLTELRAEIVGKTLLGMRVDDVIHAIDYVAARKDIDANNITVVASGHMGLVALHAAVLDPRIKHVTVDHVLESYRSLLEAPMPVDAPQDVLPGVLLKYDVQDLVRVLGGRLTATDWHKGTENLAVK